MTKTIFKYPVVVADTFVLNLPKGAETLTVQIQHKEPQLWVLLDPNAPKEERFFRLAGTGHPITYDMGREYKYINSFQLDNGNLVFHLFEILGV